ncbi:MAG TPA: molecular chaperone SurA, partial [Thioploca sp.]|nr:molecular chaperone SurA [Thioploca sp.]
KVEDSQLNETLRRLAAQEKMDLSDYRAQIENKGYSYKYWREELRHEIIINRLKQRLVVSRATITDREVDNFLANQVKQGTVGKEYHIWHILIAMPEAPTAEDIATKQQKANNVFAKLKQGADFKTTAVAVSEGRQAIQGGDLGWLKAGNIPTLFESIVNNITVGEIKGPLRDASGFHIIKLVDKRGGESIITQTNVRHILIKTNDLVSDFDAQNHLEELKSRIEQGDDFIELARANSEDAGSAANGGSLGWINPNDFVPEFEDVMNSLSENQVSKAFKSRFGWHIVQVLGRRQHENTEQAWRTQATQQIRQRKIEDLEQAWRRQLREEGYIEYRNGDFANDAESTGFR